MRIEIQLAARNRGIADKLLDRVCKDAEIVIDPGLGTDRSTIVRAQSTHWQGTRSARRIHDILAEKNCS